MFSSELSERAQLLGDGPPQAQALCHLLPRPGEEEEETQREHLQEHVWPQQHRRWKRGVILISGRPLMRSGKAQLNS